MTRAKERERRGDEATASTTMQLLKKGGVDVEELRAENEELKQRNEELQKRLDELVNQLDALKAEAEDE
eukprot:g12306.t1